VIRLDPQQECYDQIESVTQKVGGETLERTVNKMVTTIERLWRKAGPDGVIVVTMSAHVPSKRITT
jgi:hypothetical protein